MLYALLLAGAVICAVQAIRATRLISAALWLAGVSALVAITLYEIGAHEAAVIELSVGAGLVTVLFVFAISIAGDDGMAEQELLPKPLALGLIALFLVILGAMVLPMDELGVSAIESSFWRFPHSSTILIERKSAATRTWRLLSPIEGRWTLPQNRKRHGDPTRSSTISSPPLWRITPPPRFIHLR